MPLSAKQERIALALASGESVAQVAKEHGAGVRTIRRWQSENATFGERVAELRREIFGQAVGKLVGQTGKAAQTLGELLHSDSESIRLQAARSIFELCPKRLENAPVIAQRPAGPDPTARATARASRGDNGPLLFTCCSRVRPSK
jgi:transposase-like protein